MLGLRRTALAVAQFCLVAAAAPGSASEKLIPEPLLLDMVLPLGAEQGTIESNVILRQNVGSDGKFIWVPEVEGAAWDGVGFELEIELQDTRYTGWNLAGQVTFGEHGSYIHGVQTRLERDNDESDTDALLLYVAGYRFSDTWSALVVAGARIPVESATQRDAASVLNASLFAEITDDFTAAIETNLRGDIRRDDALTFIPQIHYAVGDHFGFQAGVSIALGSESEKTEALLRLIYSF